MKGNNVQNHYREMMFGVNHRDKVRFRPGEDPATTVISLRYVSHETYEKGWHHDYSSLEGAFFYLKGGNYVRYSII